MKNLKIKLIFGGILLLIFLLFEYKYINEGTVFEIDTQLAEQQMNKY